MSARPKLATVAPASKLRLKRVTAARALELHPNPEHARRWMRAINVLRTRTRCGWIYDKPTQKKGPTQ